MTTVNSEAMTEDEPYEYDLNTVEGLIDYIEELKDVTCPDCSARPKGRWDFEQRSDTTVIVRCVTRGCHANIAQILKRRLNGAGQKTPVRLVSRSVMQVDGNASLALVPQSVWVLASLDDPPVVFRYIDDLVVVRDGGNLSVLDTSALTLRLANLAVWKDDRGRSIDPPRAIATAIISQAPTLDELPVLDRIVTVPVVGSDGQIDTQPGYRSQTRTFYSPVLPDLEVPDTVDAEDVQGAVDWLLDDLLGDFPFVTDADRAHALACMLQPFVRDLIDGPTPLYVIEAPVKGTGKSLLGHTLLIPSSGSIPDNPWPDTETEQRKSIATLVRTGATAVLWDNVRGAIRSETLEAVLTSCYWRDRILGSSNTIDAPITQTWLMTANNLQIGGDLIRRVIKIRLDAQDEQPWHRAGPWKHDLTAGWATRNRTSLALACLVLCKWWRQQGSPTPVIAAEHTMGGYEAWQNVLGGILLAANAPGFLGNVTDLDAADDELGDLTETLIALADQFDGEFTSAEAFEAMDFWGQKGIGSVVALGRSFSSIKNRPAGGHVLRPVTRNRAANAWRIEEASVAKVLVDNR